MDFLNDELFSQTDLTKLDVNAFCEIVYSPFHFAIRRFNIQEHFVWFVQISTTTRFNFSGTLSFSGSLVYHFYEIASVQLTFAASWSSRNSLAMRPFQIIAELSSHPPNTLSNSIMRSPLNQHENSFSQSTCNKVPCNYFVNLGTFFKLPLHK